MIPVGITPPPPDPSVVYLYYYGGWWGDDFHKNFQILEIFFVTLIFFHVIIAP